MSYDHVISRVRCAKYVIRTKRERDFVVGYEIELVEGHLVHAEVHTSHSFDIKEFVPLNHGPKLRLFEIFDSWDQAAAHGDEIVKKSRERWEEVGRAFQEK